MSAIWCGKRVNKEKTGPTTALIEAAMGHWRTREKTRLLLGTAVMQAALVVLPKWWRILQAARMRFLPRAPLPLFSPPFSGEEAIAPGNHL